MLFLLIGAHTGTLSNAFTTATTKLEKKLRKTYLIFRKG